LDGVTICLAGVVAGDEEEHELEHAPHEMHVPQLTEGRLGVSEGRRTERYLREKLRNPSTIK
jgi:hypothetical protein